ncbi:DHS-like NAD/FAD-binding domain-containing protein [Bombardia bombarda]|uniref:DHS-like NAD/FAD-binding domain-containing protein n=1 Tax=Bombardia bombarda TaxID=252184 RepID=A0AA40C7W9_9PEZI|nr:DHS-like NAD/FAD-binding domain-containing protein [Bombardia bombarda]
MGQDQSTVSDDTPPQTLTERSLDAVAHLIKSGKARRVVVMTGAGISTAAGIPDFRSPETGLYANLAALDLPEPEAVFDLVFFKQNPRPFYVLAKDLYPGNFHPTVSHVFISLLAQKSLLHQLFTQNIDCLERAAGIPGHLIVEAHGSFADQRCIDCKTAYPADLMRAHVARAEVPRCVDVECGGLVKPDIVFFHEALPSLFYDRMPLAETADLVLVMGTSLQVHPFAGLPEQVPGDVPRVLFNLERVGSLGSHADDVLVLGDCDSGVRLLADALGWREELEATWRGLVGDGEAERQLRGRMRKKTPAVHDGGEEEGGDDVDDVVARLADEVKKVLRVQETTGDIDSHKVSRKAAEASDEGVNDVADGRADTPRGESSVTPESSVGQKEDGIHIISKPRAGAGGAGGRKDETAAAATPATSATTSSQIHGEYGTTFNSVEHIQVNDQASPEPLQQGVVRPLGSERDAKITVEGRLEDGELGTVKGTL